MTQGRPSFAKKKKSKKFFEWSRLEYIRLGGKCPLCKNAMSVPRSGIKNNPPDCATADHIIDLEKGGTNDYSNLQLICSKCNSLKNTQKIDRRYLRTEIERLIGDKV